MGMWRRPIFADLANATLSGWHRIVREHLHTSDHRMFHKATGVQLSTLMDDARWLKMRRAMMRRIMGIDKVVEHPLNELGLHVLRALVSERIADKVRVARGSHRHPLYERFMRDGVLILRNVVNSSRALETLFEAGQVDALLRMASGFQQLEARGFTPWATYTHVKADPQFYAHVDTYHPTWKIFVFHRTRLRSGPLHYVRGSHRATLGKLRWLYNRTRILTSARATAAMPVLDATGPFADATHGFHGSLRMLGFDPEVHHSSAEQYYGFEQYGFEKPTPIVTSDGLTLVVVDVSGVHYRGFALPGATRIGSIFSGQGGGCSGCLPRKNPFYCEALPQAC